MSLPLHHRNAQRLKFLPSLVVIDAQQLAELRLATGQSRHHRAGRHLQRFGNFPVRHVLQIKQGQRRAMQFIDLLQRLHHRTGVHVVHDAGWNLRQLMHRVRHRDVRESRLMPELGEKFPVQRGQQPGLELRRVAQLMPPRRPDEKSFLHQIRRRVLVPTQAQRKAEQCSVMLLHHLCEI